MAKAVNVKLVLVDGFTSPMLRATATLQKASKTATAAEKARVKEANAAATAQAAALNRTIKSYQGFAASVKRITARVTALIAPMVVGGSIRLAFSTGAELETLRGNIETVTKSATRASEVMANAIALANKSAFSNSQMIGAASMLETYGLRTEKYLKTIGDAAAITGQDVQELAKAFGKATTTGQFQSLANIGVTRQTLDAYAKTKGINLFNGSQIRDQGQFADTLAALLSERYGGGMERQASTVSGMVSTIKGMVSTAAAQIVGVTSDGTVQMGSLFDRVRKKLAALMARLEKWQKDGTLAKIASRAADAFDKLWAAGEKTVRILTNPIFQFAALMIGNIVVAVKAVTAAYAAWHTVTQVMQIAQRLLNDEMKANVIMLVVTAVITLIEYFVILYQRSEKFRNIVKSIGEGIVWVFDKIKSAFEWIKDKFRGGAVTVEVEGEAADSGEPEDVPSYASGTSRHPGGPARINERGGEIVDLPSGSRVIPAQQVKKEAGRGVTVNIYVTGANRSDEELADMIAGRVMEAIEAV